MMMRNANNSKIIRYKEGDVVLVWHEDAFKCKEMAIKANRNNIYKIMWISQGPINEKVPETLV
jgi:hypothetical protein